MKRIKNIIVGALLLLNVGFTTTPIGPNIVQASQVKTETIPCNFKVKIDADNGHSVSAMNSNNHSAKRRLSDGYVYKVTAKKIFGTYACLYKIGKSTWVSDSNVTLENYSRPQQHKGFMADAEFNLYDHTHITVYSDHTPYTKEIVSATHKWDKSKVKFIVSNNPNSDIKISLLPKNYRVDSSEFDATTYQLGRKDNGSVRSSQVYLNNHYLKHDSSSYVALVVAHELGHAIGLDHTSSRKSIMYPYGKDNMRSVSTGDVKKVNSYYANIK